MSAITWDDIGSHVYESGVDHAVLYLPNGTAVPWNGITGITEKVDSKVETVYFDGMKVNDLATVGDFSASISAYTYPDEFLEVEGLAQIGSGTYLAEQPPMSFGLAYRTKVGDDVEGLSAGYKLHVLYNLTAIPGDKSYKTISNSPSPVDFSWDVTAVPEEINGYRPSCHFIIDSRSVSSGILAQIEDALYGTVSTDPRLIPMDELVTIVTGEVTISIVDNGDGTWTATTSNSALIVLDGTDIGLFTIYDATVVIVQYDAFGNPVTYQISNTL